MKKIIDWLFDAFGWLYMVFLCSLVIPLIVGLSLAILPIFFGNVHFKGYRYPFLFYGVSIAFGLFLKLWLDERHKK